MRKRLLLMLVGSMLIAGCMSRNEVTDPPCGAKEIDAGLCKDPPQE
jgi:hypothetical protein